MTDTPPKFTLKTDDKEPAKRGPGRPKGSTNKGPTATAVNADVRSAMSTLDSAYNLIATGLVIAGLEQTAVEWADSAEQLKSTNEDALKASPKLARMIANAGSTGGGATLLLTHGMALAGLFKTAQRELVSKREQAREAAQAEATEKDPTAF